MIRLINETGRTLTRGFFSPRLKRLSEILGIRGDITVKLGDPAESQRLNRLYRHRDHPTDVLSFPLHDQTPDGKFYIGDIFICREIADRQARQRNIPPLQEYLRLVIHGTLHLLGYDHPLPESEMIALQEKLLEKIG